MPQLYRPPATFRMEEELPLAAVTPALEDEGPAAALLSPWKVPQATITVRDDEAGTGLAYFFLDTEEPSRTPYQVVIWLPRLFQDEDAVPSAAVAQDDEQASAIATQGVYKNAGAARDDEVGSPLAFFFLDQEDGPRNVSWASPWQVASQKTDEELAAVASTLDDEQPPLLAYQVVSRPAALTLDDETGIHLANFYLEQEEPSRTPQQAQPWLPLAFLEEQPWTPFIAPGLDDEQPWVAQVVTTPWLPLTFPEEQPWVPFVAPALDDEQAWLGSVIATSWLAVPFTDDDLWSSFVPPPPNVPGLIILDVASFSLVIFDTASLGEVMVDSVRLP